MNTAVTPSDPEKLERLRNYLGSVMPHQGGLESLEELSPEQIVQGSKLSDKDAETVLSAVDKVRKNERPSDDEQFALEAIVFPDRRPVFDIVNDDFSIATVIPYGANSTQIPTFIRVCGI
jgi:hypothetical protein